MFLKNLNSEALFHPAIPAIPMGRYAHFVLLRETTSYSLFQTDGQLNFAKVQAGIKDKKESVSRVVMFKRKQTTPERLTGRELLRRYGLLSGVEGNARYCEYNSAAFCKVCPDCIFYGFAIGQEGSERSKILVDSAFSLSLFDESHESFTFNAPYEHGTMSEGTVTKSSFGEQDHVKPQVIFPAVVTIHDPTEAEFIYVLNNILRTKRYGAQTTRTGSLENHLVAVVFSDGEIFSNLKLTQTLYDKVAKEAKGHYEIEGLVQQTVAALPGLLAEDGVVANPVLTGESLNRLVEEVSTIIRDEGRLQAVLQQAYTESEQYARSYGAKRDKKANNPKADKKASKGPEAQQGTLLPEG